MIRLGEKIKAFRLRGGRPTRAGPHGQRERRNGFFLPPEILHKKSRPETVGFFYGEFQAARKNCSCVFSAHAARRGSACRRADGTP